MTQKEVKTFDSVEELKRFRRNNPAFAGKFVVEVENEVPQYPTIFDEERWVSRNPDVTKEAIAVDSRPHQVLQLLVENGAVEGGYTNAELAKFSVDESLTQIRAGAATNTLAVTGFADRVEDTESHYYRASEKGIERLRQLGKCSKETESDSVLDY
jgi:hypothetical protein